MSFPNLANDTIALRTWTEQDVDALVSACNDPALRDQLGLPAPYTHNDAHDYIRACAAGWAAQSQFTFAVTERIRGMIVGSLRVGASPHGATAGYWTAPWARRHGMASGALRLVTAWALENGRSPIRLYIDPENVASRHVASNAAYRRDPKAEIVDPEGRAGDLVFIAP